MVQKAVDLFLVPMVQTFRIYGNCKIIFNLNNIISQTFKIRMEFSPRPTAVVMAHKKC
jgi:hypothetical protein